jgi:hypothetical protein
MGRSEQRGGGGAVGARVTLGAVMGRSGERGLMTHHGAPAPCSHKLNHACSRPLLGKCCQSARVAAALACGVPARRVSRDGHGSAHDAQPGGVWVQSCST